MLTSKNMLNLAEKNVKLATLITMHKAQGLSLQSALIDAGPTTFGSGMTYVALSRLTSLQGLHLIDFDRSKIKCDRKAIIEYNRLRRTYLPYLGNLDSTHEIMQAQKSRAKGAENKYKLSDNSDITETKENSEKFRKSKKMRTEETEKIVIPEAMPTCTISSIFTFCSVTSMSEEFRRSTINRLSLPSCQPDNTRSTTTLAICQDIKNMIYRETNYDITVAIHKIIGDGNCLFRALSLALTQSQSHHELIRAYIVNHMNDPALRNTMEEIFVSRSQNAIYSYQEHVLQMAKVGIWGTEHEIVTAAQLLECSIICVSDYGGQMAMQQFAPHFPVECTEDCMHETIYTVNKNDHYDLASVCISDMEE
jgi:hypothetical protein